MASTPSSLRRRPLEHRIIATKPSFAATLSPLGPTISQTRPSSSTASGASIMLLLLPKPRTARQLANRRSPRSGQQSRFPATGNSKGMGSRTTPIISFQFPCVRPSSQLRTPRERTVGPSVSLRLGTTRRSFACASMASTVPTTFASTTTWWDTLKGPGTLPSLTSQPSCQIETPLFRCR